MKVRTDFVTNSSSVSYVLTMNKELTEIMIKNYGEYEKEQAAIAQHVYEDMLKTGTLICLDNHELYYKTIEFSTDEQLTKDDQEETFTEMKESDKVALINGEYIMRGQLPKLTNYGIGVTQVETY